MKLVSLALIGIALIAVFQNCGQLPNFSGYRPESGLCGGSDCMADFSSLSGGSSYVPQTSPPTPLKAIPSDIAYVMMRDLNCYNLMFSNQTVSNSANSDYMQGGTSYYGNIRTGGINKYSLMVQNFFGDFVLDGANLFSVPGPLSHSGSLCARAATVGNLLFTQIRGTNSVLSLLPLSDKEFLSGDTVSAQEAHVPIVLINPSLKKLSASNFHQDVFIYNGTVDLVQGDSKNLHLYGSARVGHWTGANLGKIYLRGNSSVGTVTTSGTGGQIIDCNIPGSNCPVQPPPDIPPPPGF